MRRGAGSDGSAGAGLHWLWTGIAAAIAWRLWHLYGRRGTWSALGGIALVMVVHSLNDSSAAAFCDDPTAGSVASLSRPLLLVVMYVGFRAWARKSTPPQLIGRVTRAWTPKLPTDGVLENQPPTEESAPVIRS